MGRTPFTLALCLIMAVSARSLAQNQPKTSPSVRPSLIEVRFGDGSLVRMTLLEETLDIQTRYGKLTVPVNEIRRIDFGLHVPPEMNKQIAQSIKRLSSDVYKERDSASKDLVHNGHFAFPSLKKASRSGDKEVRYRAVSVIKQISERTPSELLRLEDHDVIQTTEFTVTGKVALTRIKAYSPHFGEVALKLSELRTLTVKQQGGKFDLVVDAAKNGSAADKWLDTGVLVEAGQRLVVVGEGNVDLWPQTPGQYLTVPKGFSNTPGKGGQFLAGALIGRIGENGKAFFIGERHESAVAEEGRLYVMIVPSPWNNASVGSYRLTIQTEPGVLATGRR